MSAPFIIVEAIFPGMTQLDFTAPHTVFSRLPGVEVIVASAEGGEVRTEGDLCFAGVKRLREIERCDLLFAPGGRNATIVMNDRAYMDEFERLARLAPGEVPQVAGAQVVEHDHVRALRITPGILATNAMRKIILRPHCGFGCFVSCFLHSSFVLVCWRAGR